MRPHRVRQADRLSRVEACRLRGCMTRRAWAPSIGSRARLVSPFGDRSCDRVPVLSEYSAEADSGGLVECGVERAWAWQTSPRAT